MAYADLLKALAEDPQGVYADCFPDAEIAEAVEAGLVFVRQTWAVDVVKLTDEGRQTIGLPAQRKGWWARLFVA